MSHLRTVAGKKLTAKRKHAALMKALVAWHHAEHALSNAQVAARRGRHTKTRRRR